MDLTGYRFHPTDKELVAYFLVNKINGLPDGNIKEVDILKFEPWDLPALSVFQSEPFWYFLWGIDYKHENSKRANRTTKNGYWKVTGRERPIGDRLSRVIGYKKTLVFHQGRGPTALRTNWIITEYRSSSTTTTAHNSKKEYVVCRLKMKNNKLEASTSNVASQYSAANDGNDESQSIFGSLLHEDYVLCPDPGSQYYYDMDDNVVPLEPKDAVQESTSHSVNNEHENGNPESSSGVTVDECYYHIGAVRTNPCHVCPPSSLKGAYAMHSSNLYYDILNLVAGKSLLRLSSADSKEQQQTKSSEGSITSQTSFKDVLHGIDLNSLTDYAELVQDKSTINLKSYKAEDSPKSSNMTERESAPSGLELKASVSKDKGKEAVEHDYFDLAGEKTAVAKVENHEEKNQTASQNTCPKLRSDSSDHSKRKGYFIIWEIPPSAYLPNPPIAYIGNVLLVVLLLALLIRDMATIR